MSSTKLYLEATDTQAIQPSKATEYSAGLDVHAFLAGRSIKMMDRQNQVWENEPNSVVTIPAGYRALIPTGWKMQCEPGMCIKFYPRSGNAWKSGIRLANGTGIIDADFPNETMVILHNTTDKTFTINHGERIAQLMVEKVENVESIVVDKLPELVSSRTGGFGHTGK